MRLASEKTLGEEREAENPRNDINPGISYGPAGVGEMTVRRRTAAGQPDFLGRPSVSPRTNTTIAALLADKPNPNAEYLANRDLQAALDANPAAAKRLARNRMLWTIVPIIVFAIFLLILLVI